jgi:hypothetical protein
MEDNNNKEAVKSTTEDIGSTASTANIEESIEMSNKTDAEKIEQVSTSSGSNTAETTAVDEPMNAQSEAAQTNLIHLTVKTPKEKETVSVSAEATVKEVNKKTNKNKVNLVF